MFLTERENRNKNKAAVLWLTGLPGAGKSTIAKHIERKLFDLGYQTLLLDGDEIRKGLCKDLGYSAEDRTENIRRVGEVAKLAFNYGAIVICSLISPMQKQRDEVRAMIPEGKFFEIFVHSPLDTCMKRDPKGLYQKALDGAIPHFTGISAPYEKPCNPEMVLDTEANSIEENIFYLIQKLTDIGIIASEHSS